MPVNWTLMEKSLMSQSGCDGFRRIGYKNLVSGAVRGNPICCQSVFLEGTAEGWGTGMSFWVAQNSLPIWQWILKTAVIFVWLLFLTRLMGQREVGQMTLFDFVIAVSIGSVAGGALSNGRGGAIWPMLSITALAAFDILLAILALKLPKFRRMVQGEPLVPVKDGRLLEDTMRRVRLNLDDLLTGLRRQKVPNLHDVEVAVLEPEGKLSVIPKGQARPITPGDLGIATQYEGLPTALIEDGNILEDNLRENLLNKDWLLGQLRDQGVDDPGVVMAATLDTKGRLFISKKGGQKLKH